MVLGHYEFILLLPNLINLLVQYLYVSWIASEILYVSACKIALSSYLGTNLAGWDAEGDLVVVSNCQTTCGSHIEGRRHWWCISAVKCVLLLWCGHLSAHKWCVTLFDIEDVILHPIVVSRKGKIVVTPPQTQSDGKKYIYSTSKGY